MKEERKVFVNNLETMTAIPYADILYCQSDEGYSRIFTKDAESIIWCKRIGDVLKELDDPRFIRISQSIVFNRAYLKRIHKKNKEIELNVEAVRLLFSIQQKELIELLKREV